MLKVKRKNQKKIIQFYDQKFKIGYMDDWSRIKKERIRKLIKGLNLPTEGRALDFGCGNGVFTQIIKKALPKWEVFGIDISPIAIQLALKRNKKCNFFLAHEKEMKNYKFDFLFTHHVLEHVGDLESTWQEMESYMNKNSAMLHILPCGNKGSFERRISLLVEKGIDKEQGQRFFYEDEGHLRRLNTKEMNLWALSFGYKLKKEFYALQFYGAINAITLIRPKFICQMTDLSRAKNSRSRRKLLKIRSYLLTLNLLRMPAIIVDETITKKKEIKA